jgi:hypothetical protein
VVIVERRSSIQLNPPAGGPEVKTLGDHLAQALAVVQRDFWLEKWLVTNAPDPSVARPDRSVSPVSRRHPAPVRLSATGGL